MANHALMAQTLALALACDQTRVFNMVFSNRASSLRRPGSSDTHHTLTHEEPRDPNLGYQPKATYFVLKSMEAWANLVETLAAVPEGDGTLLDNCLVMAHSETSEANTHSVVLWGQWAIFRGENSHSAADVFGWYRGAQRSHRSS